MALAGLHGGDQHAVFAYKNQLVRALFLFLFNENAEAFFELVVVGTYCAKSCLTYNMLCEKLIFTLARQGCGIDCFYRVDPVWQVPFSPARRAGISPIRAGFPLQRNTETTTDGCLGFLFPVDCGLGC